MSDSEDDFAWLPPDQPELDLESESEEDEFDGKEGGKKKKKKQKWVTSAARKRIVQDMIDGRVPVDEPIKDAEKLYNEFYKDLEEFKDFPYYKRSDSKQNWFSGKGGRFHSLQTIVKRFRDGAASDVAAYEHDMMVMAAKRPPKKVDKRGEPLWKYADADTLLDIDMQAEKHLQMKPRFLRAQRPEYKEMNPKRFRDRIDQKKQLSKRWGKKPGQHGKSKRKIGTIENDPSISRKYVVDPYNNVTQKEAEEEYADDDSVHNVAFANAAIDVDGNDGTTIDLSFL